MVTIDLLILTCSTPEAAKVDFQTLFCKMLKKKRTIQYKLYSIVDEVLYMAKCNLGKVKIHPMLGSSFTKFRERGVGGGGGPKVLIHLYMYVLSAFLRLASSAQFVFPSLPSQVS